VRPGTSLAEACALFPEALAERVHVEPYAPERDASTLRALAVWSMRFAPIVAPDPPDGLLLDVTGCERIYGDDRRMLALLAASFAGLGIRPRIAVAPTFGSARAVARHGDDPLAVVEPGAVRETLAPLPVEALDLEKDVLEALAEMGIDEIAHLLRLGRRDLAARFGDDLLLRLDQALGAALEAVAPVRHEEPVRIEHRFSGPTVRLDAIEVSARGLLARLEVELESREAGALELRLSLARVERAPVDLRVLLGRPSRDPRHLEALLRPKLERANLGFGVEGIELTVLRAAPLPRRQKVHSASGLASERLDEKRALGEMLDTLAGRIGWGRVRRFEAIPSHLPERAFRSRSLIELEPAPGVNGAEPGGARGRAGDRGRRGDGDPGAAPGERPHVARPTVLFERPDPIERMETGPTGAPEWFLWRGEPFEVAAAVGPERIGSEWWRDPVALPRELTTRDYYRVQNDRGRWLWIFCEGGDEDHEGTWHVHGEWS